MCRRGGGIRARYFPLPHREINDVLASRGQHEPVPTSPDRVRDPGVPSRRAAHPNPGGHRLGTGIVRRWVPARAAPDDAERDETPDEVGDLAWPQVKLVARAGSLWPRVGSPRSFSAALAEFGRAGLGPDDLPHGPRDGRDIGSSVALSVLLCRLIC